jgi:hypothetical protein
VRARREAAARGPAPTYDRDVNPQEGGLPHAEAGRIMRLRRGESRQEPTSPRPYRPPTWLGVIGMLVVSVVGIFLVWQGFLWALTQWSPP